MANPVNNNAETTDVNAPDRKKDHIQLAFQSKIPHQLKDTRFNYEPLLAAHPDASCKVGMTFMGYDFNAPIWVSSMTGGTKMAAIINKNLATACGEFKLGMGLGSCRQLLFNDEYISDFQVRKWMNDQPLFANLGIAQLENLIENNQLFKVSELVKKLEADGLIIHVNPFQEWLQPEGDRYKKPAIETIIKVLDQLDTKIIVKEVGQGMGPKSIQRIMELPILAFDFAASGGTNFALLEILRSDQPVSDNFNRFANIGHSADEMVNLVNQLIDNSEIKLNCKEVIISGGINDFLDGYYLTKKLNIPSVYGQASAFLKHAQSSYEQLQRHIFMQIKGLSMANAFLTIK